MAEAPERTPPLTVLVAEDQDEIAEAVELILEDLGHTHLRVRDGVEALRVLPRLNPDLILLDISMPRMDGFAVLRELQAWSEHPPVVVMSAFHEFLPETRRLGAVTTLAKPFTLEELDQALRLAHQRWRPTEAPAEPPPGAAVPGPGTVGLPGIDEVVKVPQPGAEAPPARDAEASFDEELSRLQKVYCLKVMGTQREEALEQIVLAASELLRTPVALVSIITDSRQWWKAMVGISGEMAQARGTARDQAFCTHAVAARAPLVVGDARSHPVFHRNPLVTSGTFAAYAGVPVILPQVGALGTLCVLDNKPRVFSAVDLEVLALLARRVAAEVEWREIRDTEKDPLPTGGFLSLMDERWGLYRPDAFTSFVGVLGRLAIAEQGTLAVLGVKPQELGNPQALELLIQAVRQAAHSTYVIGWLDRMQVGVALPRGDLSQAKTFVQAAEARHRALRATEPFQGYGELHWAFEVVPGAIEGDSVVQRLRSRLERAVQLTLDDLS